MNKFRVTFKSPDACFDAMEELPEEIKADAENLLRKFVEYGEYVTIEFDLDAGSAKVIPLRD
jgi:hypothetical protein